MSYAVSFKKILIVAITSMMLTACATTTKKSTGQMQGDVYTGTDTVEYLATGVKDRVFFATNKSTLTTASRDTLRKQAAFMRKKKDLSFTIEGHADERGTREYNLALGDRRANAVLSYLAQLGVASGRLQSVSFGEERPAKKASSEAAYALNRRAEFKIR